MQQLFIIGAGGFGREVLEWALAMPAAGRDWQVAGFLDDYADALKGHDLPVSMVGTPGEHAVRSNHLFICALGDPRQRVAYATSMRQRGGQFINIIHPTVSIGRNCRIGQGCILCPHVVVTCNVTLEDFVVVNCCSVVGHDAVVGEGATLSPHCTVAGRVRLGGGVFLGSHASILPKAVVEDFAVVGAGSVVLRRAAAHTTVMGVPAKQLYSGKGHTK